MLHVLATEAAFTPHRGGLSLIDAAASEHKSLVVFYVRVIVVGFFPPPPNASVCRCDLERNSKSAVEAAVVNEHFMLIHIELYYILLCTFYVVLIYNYNKVYLF